MFWRWRDVLMALGLSGVGLFFALTAFGILKWIGWVMAALGLFGAIAAWQRMRFAGTGDGAGVVTLDERRVIYLGPTDGGVLDLDLMVQLDLTPSSKWRLIKDDGDVLEIPSDAKGADTLFDVFNALPGMKTEYMLSVLERPRAGQMTIWIAPDHKPYTVLH